MKTFISISALILSLTLTAQTNTANWYYNDSGLNGIQSPSNTASGSVSVAMGLSTTASGNFSTAMGRDSQASGEYSTAMGNYSRAIGSSSTAMGDNTEASGDYSTAMGVLTRAIGNYSTAMGKYTEAIGNYSTAFGQYTIASGDDSTAFGQYTEAFGNNSIAIGYRVTARDWSSLVMGQFNLAGSTVPENATGFNINNTAFVIGNGVDGNSRSDALVVKFNGDATLAGSMTATSFIGDGSQLTNLPSSGGDSPFSYNSNQAGGIEVAGYTTASGSSAFAVGNDNLASGSYSTAMGRGTTASGSKSTAMGQNTIASGDTSTAMGYLTTASGRRSTAMGEETIASGSYSTAMGAYTTAEDFLTVALGVHNKTDETPNPNEFSFQNTAFVIGNGGFANDGSYIGTPESYSNAFEVLFDGTTTIAGDLNVNSDARLKANIVSLGATLSKLLQIDGKSYTMKKDESEKQKIGLLAQDIEKVFPELVSESHGVKSVNYQGLVPVLINALKEQQNEIEILKQQQSEIDELKTMLKTLIEKT